MNKLFNSSLCYGSGLWLDSQIHFQDTSFNITRTSLVHCCSLDILGTVLTALFASTFVMKCQSEAEHTENSDLIQSLLPG